MAQSTQLGSISTRWLRSSTVPHAWHVQPSHVGHTNVACSRPTAVVAPSPQLSTGQNRQSHLLRHTICTYSWCVHRCLCLTSSSSNRMFLTPWQQSPAAALVKPSRQQWTQSHSRHGVTYRCQQVRLLLPAVTANILYSQQWTTPEVGVTCFM
jgi:hypothetical protein